VCFYVSSSEYAAKHGYSLFVENELFKPEELLGDDQYLRKPSWLKVRDTSFEYSIAERTRVVPIQIKAVQRHLKDFDWVFWMDADSLILNMDVRLESFLDERYDFIVTYDLRGIV